jgi:hypothetical protein
MLRASLSWSGPAGRAHGVLGGEVRGPRAQTGPCLLPDRLRVDGVYLSVQSHISDVPRMFHTLEYVQGVKSVTTSASLSLRNRVRISCEHRASFGLPAVEAVCSTVDKPGLSNVEDAIMKGNLEALDIGMVLPPPMI